MAGKAVGVAICALASGGVLPATMRWTNRPTFQQVISSASDRKR